MLGLDGYTSEMPAIKKIAMKLLSKMFSIVPLSLLQLSENLIQKQLGKGSGAWSTADEAKAIAKIAKDLNIDHVIAIDVGANVGDWTDELSKLIPTAEIYAFEPSKSAFEKLDSRFEKNTNIQCLNYALGDSNYTGTLFADSSGSGLGSLTKRRLDHFQIRIEHEEKVIVHTLDDFFGNNFPDVKPNILKMDVEGHELDVISGASNILNTVQIVQFEFGGSNIDTRTYFQDFWYFFKEQGFNLYRLLPNCATLIHSYSEHDETFLTTNYIAVRNNLKFSRISLNKSRQ